MTPQADPSKTKLIRFPEVIERTSKSRAAIYAAMNRGRFPKTVKLGRKSVAFLEHEIDAWIAEHIAQRDAHEATRQQSVAA